MTGLGQGLCSLGKAFYLLALTGKGFDDSNPREAFLQGDGQVTSLLLHPHLQRTEQSPNAENHTQKERQTDQRQAKQAPIEPGHRYHRPGASQGHAEPDGPAKLEEQTDGFDISRGA